MVNVTGGGDQEWAVVELEAHSKCKNGKKADCIHVNTLLSKINPAGDPYEQRYSWSLRFNENGTIVQVSPYVTGTLCNHSIQSRTARCQR